MDIQFEKVSYRYQIGTPFESVALDEVSLTIQSGSFTALIGHTGSGKSTLIEHLNGLLIPQSGKIYYNHQVLKANDKKQDLRALRQKVGLVFQFPEAQLFEETVLKDVRFGPMNFGKTEEEATALAKEALQLVGLDECYFERSPLELSGGQMRRVAIAGVLAMKPEVLVLDEPTAGLDPKGQQEMMSLFKSLNDQGMTIVLVTHRMEDVVTYCDSVCVMENGQLLCQESPQTLFQKTEFLKAHRLDVPWTVQFAKHLEQRGLSFETLPMNIQDLVADLEAFYE